MWCYLVNDTEDPRFEPCLSTIHHLRFLICITSYYLDATKCFMLNNKVKKRPRIALKVYFIISQLVLFAPNRKVRNQLSSSGSLVVNTIALKGEFSRFNFGYHLLVCVMRAWWCDLLRVKWIKISLIPKGTSSQGSDKGQEGSGMRPSKSMDCLASMAAAAAAPPDLCRMVGKKYIWIYVGFDRL